MNNRCVAVMMPVQISETESLRPKETAARLSHLARQTAVFSANRSGHALYSFPKDEKGAPLPEDGVYWSISHKKTYVAGVVATCPIGIDIEQIKPMKKDMFDRIATKEEWRLFKDPKEDSFFRVWTGKEAMLKMIGIGYRGISDCCVRAVEDDHTIQMSYLGNIWTIHYFRFDGHMVAIVPKEKRDIQWDVVR